MGEGKNEKQVYMPIYAFTRLDTAASATPATAYLPWLVFLVVFWVQYFSVSDDDVCEGGTGSNAVAYAPTPSTTGTVLPHGVMLLSAELHWCCLSCHLFLLRLFLLRLCPRAAGAAVVALRYIDMQRGRKGSRLIYSCVRIVL